MEDWKINDCDNTGVIIGSGSFGSVYLKEWRRTKVAVKILENNDMLSMALFDREFDIMTKMHHPNIVQLLGYIEEPFAIVMEYLPGRSLADKKKMSWYEKKRLSLDVLRGLTYMHNRTPQQCIHRDIKPRNILFTPSKTAKIADMGLSKLISKSSNTDLYALAHSKDVGTMRYAAPETQGDNSIYDSKVDIYSTGVMLYEVFENFCIFENELKWAVAPFIIRPILKNMTLLNSTERMSAIECYDKISNIKLSLLKRIFNT